MPSFYIPSNPLFAFLQIEGRCNHRCPGCSNAFTAERHFIPDIKPVLSALQWRGILEKLEPAIFRYAITGGEPTLHPEFEQIVQLVETQQKPFAIFTHGQWTQPEHLVDFLSGLEYFEGFLVSLHGATPGVHLAFNATPGSFEDTVANIRLATRAGLRVTTNTVITKANFNHLPPIVDVAAELGAERAIFNRYVGYAFPGMPMEDQLQHAIDSVEALRLNAPVAVELGNCIPQCFCPSSSRGFLSGIFYITIDPWGNALPSNQSSTIAGSLLSDSLDEVWQSSIMDTWRGMTPDDCWSCSAFSQCLGGSRDAALSHPSGRDPLIGKPLCEPPNDRQIFLPPDLLPKSRFDIRIEAFGVLLVHADRVKLVSPETLTLLDMLDGNHTLAQIQDIFGDAALALVGSLLMDEMVEMSEY